MKGQGYQTVPGSLFIAYLLKEGILTAYQSCSKIDTYQKNLKFDTKHNGKPVKSRLPVFCLHVVYRSDLNVEKIFLINTDWTVIGVS